MKDYINYQNSLNVLNEGFFSWVWKLTKQMFKKILAASDFNDLNNNITKLEKIIKYGAKKNGMAAVSESLNESNVLNEKSSKQHGRKRSRGAKNAEDEYDYMKYLDDEENDNPSSKKNLWNKFKDMFSDYEYMDDDKSEKNYEDDKNSENTNTQTTSSTPETQSASDDKNIVPKEKINMNIPSYRATCITMLNALEEELKDAKRKATPDVITNWTNGLAEGKTLHPRDAQYIQLLVTDFIRKYSAGQIAPPSLNGKDLLSNSELQQWNQLLSRNESGKNSETQFKSVYDALHKVLENYNTNFKETLEEIINNTKNEEDKNDKNNAKMIRENKFKLQTKWDGIYQRCENFIPTAIANYFINDDVYKNGLDFIKELLPILIKNSDIVNKSSKSEIGRLVNLDDEDKQELIENVVNLYNKFAAALNKFNDDNRANNISIDIPSYINNKSNMVIENINEVIESCASIYKKNKNIKSSDILEQFVNNINAATKDYPILFILIIKILDKNIPLNYQIKDSSNNMHNIAEFLK